MRKALTLALVLTLCLAITGVAYGVWGGDRFIDGTVQTGSVDVQWRYYGFTDNEPCGDDYAKVEENEDGQLRISEDGATIYVVIDNAYPGYEATLDLGLHNVGTVPAVIKHVTYEVDEGLEVMGEGVIFPVGNETACLKPCKPQKGTLTVKVLDTVEPSSTYTFKVTIDPGVQL